MSQVMSTAQNGDADAARTRSALMSGWGLTNPTRADLTPRTNDAAQATTPEATFRHERGVVARGLGRSYNDAAQNAGGVVSVGEADAGIEIDPNTGITEVRSGTSLERLLEAAVPQGWFVPVIPGTRHVTVGGMIAADIHGKNHHGEGSLGRHLRAITLDAPVGQRRLRPDDADPSNVAQFWATTGGMGLTGIIRSAEMQLIPIETALMRVDTHKFANLDDLICHLRHDNNRYSVAWVDASARGQSLGRAVVTSGEHATRAELPHRMSRRNPTLRFSNGISVPRSPLNVIGPSTTAAFNELWFRHAPRQRIGELQSIARFFHPLDGLRQWNRLYGPRGLLQWQCAVPLEADHVLRLALERLAAARLVSPMVILKRFGSANPAPMSFPIPGWTLAIDLPAGPDSEPVLDALDDAVVEAGGRLYLAKDARMRPSHLATMYPRIDDWRETCDQLDPQRAMRSDLDRRLDLRGREPHHPSSTAHHRKTPAPATLTGTP